MKKALAVFLSALMLAMVIVPTLAFADETLALEVTADKTTAQRGDEVTVSVSATENPGWLMFGATPVFDKTNMTQKVTNGAGITYGSIGSGTKGKVANIDAGGDDTTETGFLFSYTITINDDCPFGDYTIGIKISDGEVVNQAEDDVPVSGTLTLTLTVSDCPHNGATTQHEAVASTCKTAGHAAYTTCDLCNAVIEGSDAALELDPANHEGQPENVEAVPSTCSTKGTTAGTKCSACDAVLSGCEEAPLDPDNHPQESLSTVEAVASTCTVAGHAEYTECTACTVLVSGSKDPLPLDESNHTNTENRNEVPATCTEAGTTAGVYCLDENKYISGGETIPVTDHTPAQEKANVKEATCTEKGYTGDVVCSVCGTVIEQGQETDMIGHTPAQEKANVKEATCTEKGYTGDTVCSVCGATIEQGQETDMIAHTPGEAVKENEVEPTTEAEGGYDEVVYCTVCGTELSREHTTIDKLDTAKVDGGEWKADSEKDLALEMPEDIEEGTPSEVVITDKDGKETTVGSDGYTYEDGVFTLKKDILGGLAEGQYTVTFRVGNTVVTGTFTTVKPATSDKTTGDTGASLIVWSMIALVSLAGAVVTASKIKKSTAR